MISLTCPRLGYSDVSQTGTPLIHHLLTSEHLRLNGYHGVTFQPTCHQKTGVPVPELSLFLRCKDRGTSRGYHPNHWKGPRQGWRPQRLSEADRPVQRHSASSHGTGGTGWAWHGRYGGNVHCQGLYSGAQVPGHGEGLSLVLGGGSPKVLKSALDSEL